MTQSGGFFSRLMGPLFKTGLWLIKNVIKPLAKSVLILLGLTAAASAADSGMEKKILGWGITGKTKDGNAKDVEIIVPLKYLSNFLENSLSAINWF